MKSILDGDDLKNIVETSLQHLRSLSREEHDTHRSTQKRESLEVQSWRPRLRPAGPTLTPSSRAHELS